MAQINGRPPTASPAPATKLAMGNRIDGDGNTHDKDNMSNGEQQ
jgi:hypothetical protein